MRRKVTERLALELLGTRGCHLCDDAERLLATVAAARDMRWRYLDVAEDDALLARYGERIPVLRAVSGTGVERELRWPFSLLDVLRLLEG